MLKKTLNKHTREFLETNLPENFFLLKKSNKKRRNYFSSKGKILATNLSKRMQASCNQVTTGLNKSLNTSKNTLNVIKKNLSSLHAIKSTFEKRQSRTSDFKNKLKEKKKLSILYGNLSSKSIRKVLKQASMLHGNLSENLLYILESRLDIILYRSLFFPSIRSAKQWIKNNKILVNSFCINVPSYNIKYGDIISVVKKSRKYVASNMLKHFIHYNIVEKPTQTFFKHDTLYHKKNSASNIYSRNANISPASKNGYNDKSSVQQRYIENLVQPLNLGAKASYSPGYSSLQASINRLEQLDFFPKWDYQLVSSIYKNINSLNDTFAHNLVLYKNVLYDNFYRLKKKPFFYTCKNTKYLNKTRYHAHSTYALRAFSYGSFYHNILCYHNSQTLQAGKQSKTIFLHMWKSMIMFKNKNIRSHLRNTNNNPVYGNTFLETSLVNNLKHKLKIFLYKQSLYSQDTTTTLGEAYKARRPSCNEVTTALTGCNKTYKNSKFPSKRAVNTGSFCEHAESSSPAKSTSFKENYTVNNKKILFLNKSVSDIKFKTKLNNVFDKKKLNLYNIFCKLNFMPESCQSWQVTAGITFFTKKQNILRCIKGFLFKNFFSFLPVNTGGRLTQAVSANKPEKLLSAVVVIASPQPQLQKNLFKKKHRYIISNMYIKTLINQIKLSNIFMFKLAVCLLNKNYILQDVYNKQNYIMSRNASRTNTKYVNEKHLNVLYLLKILSKKTKNLSTYTNIFITKYKITLSKINRNFLITIKNIFKIINTDKNNYLVGKTAPAMLDLLFFLKLKKIFLNSKHSSYNEIKHKINVKPLNLEISYKTLTIIYLYPPQKLVFPCSLDIELLLRYNI